MVRGGGGGGREGDGRPLVSWLGRIRAVWDRSDLTQPSFSRTGHVRLDLSHTTDIIPLSGETTAHHHSTADRGEREGRKRQEIIKKKKGRGRWIRKHYANRRREGSGAVVRLRRGKTQWGEGRSEAMSHQASTWPDSHHTVHTHSFRTYRTTRTTTASSDNPQLFTLYQCTGFRRELHK